MYNKCVITDFSGALRGAASSSAVSELTYKRYYNNDIVIIHSIFVYHAISVVVQRSVEVIFINPLVIGSSSAAAPSTASRLTHVGSVAAATLIVRPVDPDDSVSTLICGVWLQDQVRGWRRSVVGPIFGRWTVLGVNDLHGNVNDLSAVVCSWAWVTVTGTILTSLAAGRCFSPRPTVVLVANSNDDVGLDNNSVAKAAVDIFFAFLIFLLDILLDILRLRALPLTLLPVVVSTVRSLLSVNGFFRNNLDRQERDFFVDPFDTDFTARRSVRFSSFIATSFAPTSRN